ncbi:hypothetical protein FOZ62_018681, partial [Perkinsus olseni]
GLRSPGNTTGAAVWDLLQLLVLPLFMRGPSEALAAHLLEEAPVSVDRRELRRIRNRNVCFPTSKSPTSLTYGLEGSPYPAAEYPLRSYLAQDKRKHVRVHSEPQWRYKVPGPCTSMEVGW